MDFTTPAVTWNSHKDSKSTVAFWSNVIIRPFRRESQGRRLVRHRAKFATLVFKLCKDWLRAHSPYLAPCLFGRGRNCIPVTIEVANFIYWKSLNRKRV